MCQWEAPPVYLDGVVALLGVVGQDLVDLAPNEARLHCDLAAIALHHAPRQVTRRVGLQGNGSPEARVITLTLSEAVNRRVRTCTGHLRKPQKHV